MRLPGILYIRDNEKTLAIVMRTSFQKDGIHFFTPSVFSQQLAYMHRPAGYCIAAHFHNPVLRQVEYTKEVLFIKSGRVRVDFYDETKKYLESIVLCSGDVVLLSGGGHGFEMLEASEIIEVKQGPYAGVMDKTCFEAVKPSEIQIRQYPEA